MIDSTHHRNARFLIALLSYAIGAAALAQQEPIRAGPPAGGDGRPRWGQRRNESDAQYDKRQARVLKKIRRDDPKDDSGGPVQMWTYRGHPFIVRSDISAEFTADTTMFMELLHREYGAVYKKLGLPPAKLKEPVEVVVFRDRATYEANGGTADTVGVFDRMWPRFTDRGPHWPAAHFRLIMFTDGVTEFTPWRKETLKHEAAHMELQLRLGLYTDCPAWWNEGHAEVFEDWDFTLTPDENLRVIPWRGGRDERLREIHRTPRWKGFQHLWTISPEQWHQAMGAEAGLDNYFQAWSLAAYMMSGDLEGRKAFRKIYDLSIRVGADQKRGKRDGELHAWEVAFPAAERGKLEREWEAWVQKIVTATEAERRESRVQARGPRCAACHGRGTVRCPTCQGNGLIACSRCGGIGSVIQDSDGRRSEVTCPTCQGGRGKPCATCQGRSTVACDQCRGARP